MISKEAVKDLFEQEFSSIKDRFVIYDLELEDAKQLKDDHVWKPGVYVFWHPVRGVIKVGRHLTNSRKRAFEHIRDNTGGKMAELGNDEEARLMLFNVLNVDDCHWVAALEIFFENKLNPEIKSQRLG